MCKLESCGRWGWSGRQAPMSRTFGEWVPWWLRRCRGMWEALQLSCSRSPEFSHHRRLWKENERCLVWPAELVFSHRFDGLWFKECSSKKIIIGTMRIKERQEPMDTIISNWWYKSIISWYNNKELLFFKDNALLPRRFQTSRVR